MDTRKVNDLCMFLSTTLIAFVPMAAFIFLLLRTGIYHLSKSIEFSPVTQRTLNLNRVILIGAQGALTASKVNIQAKKNASRNCCTNSESCLLQATLRWSRLLNSSMRYLTAINRPSVCRLSSGKHPESLLVVIQKQNHWSCVRQGGKNPTSQPTNMPHKYKQKKFCLTLSRMLLKVADYETLRSKFKQSGYSPMLKDTNSHFSPPPHSRLRLVSGTCLISSCLLPGCMLEQSIMLNSQHVLVVMH